MDSADHKLWVKQSCICAEVAHCMTLQWKPAEHRAHACSPEGLCKVLAHADCIRRHLLPKLLHNCLQRENQVLALHLSSGSPMHSITWLHQRAVCDLLSAALVHSCTFVPKHSRRYKWRMALEITSAAIKTGHVLHQSTPAFGRTGNCGTVRSSPPPSAQTAG